MENPQVSMEHLVSAAKMSIGMVHERKDFSSIEFMTKTIFSEALTRMADELPDSPSCIAVYHIQLCELLGSAMTVIALGAANNVKEEALGSISLEELQLHMMDEVLELTTVLIKRVSSSSLLAVQDIYKKNR